ncbi:MAG: PGF-CTERM sorting domain-containing protein [Candidatus Thorarchaeota archaeon]
MNKSKILAAVMLLAMFSSLFSVATIVTPAQFSVASAPAAESSFVYPDYTPVPLGEKGIWAANIADSTITADGDLSDWVDIPFGIINGINVSLAYDSSYVYIALQWKDTAYDIAMGKWNKTGMITDTLVDWQFVDGADDVLLVGFDDGTDSDLMIWTASNRTQGDYMFECDVDGVADGGTLPYEMNTNETDTFDDAKPLYDDDWAAIADETTVANGTMYKAWHDVDSITPTGSQTDAEIYWDWNTTIEHYYTMEFVRDLDTSQTDDFVIDFSSPLTFYLGVADSADTYEMLIDFEALEVSLTNDDAELVFDVVADEITESLLITGTVYDDYEGWDLIVELSGWEDTYGPDSYDYCSVNVATGNWSYLFLFNENDMPLGDQTITVTFMTRYNGTLVEEQDTYFDDVKAPTIQGIVDIAERYPDGVPMDEEYVVVTVGLDDDYARNDDLTAYLYSYKGNDVALATIMTQFSPGSTTFIANITLVHDPVIAYNYTYFIEAYDTNLNKETSDHYMFTSATTVETPGFGFILGIFGLAAAVFIVKKAKK